MFNLFRYSSARLMIGSVLASAVTFVSLPGRTQSPGDIVVIGDSPAEWSEFQNYWNQLINLSAPPPAASPRSNDPFEQSNVDPQALKEELARNLKVSGLRLIPIIKLNGSSEVTGMLTNKNRDAVVVTGVNFEVLDAKGNLVQTGSASPEPSNIQPGQSVTFKSALATIPADSGYTVRLSDFPFEIRGGI